MYNRGMTKCKVCEVQFEQSTGRGRPRKTCVECGEKIKAAVTRRVPRTPEEKLAIKREHRRRWIENNSEKYKQIRLRHDEKRKSKREPRTLLTKQENNRRHRIRAFYKLSWKQYMEMFESQGGRCFICGVHQDDIDKSFSVDHDHACCPGKKSCGECVRGLLCSNCNTGIGFLQDSPKILQSAIDYLTSSGSPVDNGSLSS